MVDDFAGRYFWPYFISYNITIFNATKFDIKIQLLQYRTYKAFLTTFAD